MKIKLGILEKDTTYLTRLVTAFNKKYSDKLELYSFTDKDLAINTVNSTKIDVLLASQSFEVDVEQLPKGCGFAYFVESPNVEFLHGQRAICKFQKADTIYKSILAIYSETATNIIGSSIDDDSAAKLFTFIPASGGVGSSTAAASCAISLAKHGKKVLYLNLEQFGSANAFFNGEGQFNLSDVIYAIKSKKTNLYLKLESTVKQDVTGVYFYDSCRVPLDLTEVNEEELQKLISELKSAGSYDYIVIDIDCILDKKTLSLLRQSHKIILVSDGSDICNLKAQRLFTVFSILKQKDNDTLIDRVYIFYNKFSNKTSKALEIPGAKILGGAPRFENATTKQIMEQLSTMKIFDKVL